MGKQIPHESLVYRALDLVPPPQARVVIVGADPYPDEQLATGIAFDVSELVSPLPPSLRNIYKELEDDLGIIRTKGSLLDWVAQDVLLLNRALTVEEGKPGSHMKEWELFIEEVIDLIIDCRDHVVFMFWGRHAKKLTQRFPKNHSHLILEASHPSPLGAYRGFFGCSHFSKCNKFLRKHKLPEIDWRENHVK